MELITASTSASTATFEPQMDPTAAVPLVLTLGLLGYWWFVLVPSERAALAKEKRRGAVGEYLQVSLDLWQTYIACMWMLPCDLVPMLTPAAGGERRPRPWARALVLLELAGELVVQGQGGKESRQCYHRGHELPHCRQH